MSPSGDMATPQARYQSFSLANMIPQQPCNNEVVWEGIESAVRDKGEAGTDSTPQAAWVWHCEKCGDADCEHRLLVSRRRSRTMLGRAPD